MSRRFILLILAGLTVLLAPASAQARTCADYSNQAGAQRAADTRDGDGDGIYCVALPCPCTRPGSSRPSRRHRLVGLLSLGAPLVRVPRRVPDRPVLKHRGSTLRSSM
jgi:hypothetical protein